MKSKKMLAQIAAFSLVFGMTGVVSSWADDIIVEGTAVTTNNVIGLVKNEDGSLSTFTVGDKLPNGEIIRRIDDENFTVSTNKKTIKY